MNAVYFDTHQFVNELKKTGLPEEQAEAITRLQQRAVAATLEQARQDYRLDELASRHDLEIVRADLKKDIEMLRAETRQNIAETKAELIRWVVGAGLLQTALITGVLLKIAHSI